MRNKFILNRAGVAELMKNPEMTAILEAKANKIKNNAGKGYETSTVVGRNRTTVRVQAMTRGAVRDNNKNNTLLKALGQ